MDVKNLDEVPAFTTKDGSEIRELLAYRNSAIRNQSLAEARLQPGASTQEHYHSKAEEIYYITHGLGRIRIEVEVREVKAGDAIAIPPGPEAQALEHRQRDAPFALLLRARLRARRHHHHGKVS